VRHVRGLPAVTVASILLAGSAWGSELSQVIQKGNHLIALNQLALTTDQIRAITPLSAQLVQAVQARNAERQALLTKAAPNLAAARKALVVGTLLPADVKTAVDELEKSLKANDDDLETSAVKIMGEIEKEFFPQQSRYVDWTPPGQSAKAAAQTLLEKAQQERETVALVLATEQQLERIRTYPLERYVLEAQKVVDDFLRPLIDPDSPDYPAAQRFMFRLVEEVRVLPEPQWQQRRQEYAERLIEGLGLAQPPGQPTQPKPYNWYDMYTIFSDLGAPDLLKGMLKARATPQQ
jgi:hypothetical protein